MRVLTIFNKYPWPVNSGDAVRNSAIAEYLVSQGVEVDVLALPQRTGVEPVQPPAGIRARVIGKPIGDYLANPVNRVRTLAGRPYQLSLSEDPDYLAKVREQIASGSYDAILVASTYAVGAVPDEMVSRTVMDTHNVEYLRLGVFAMGGPLMRAVGPRVVKLAKRYEADSLRRVPVTLACSEIDAGLLDELAPGADIRVVPNGVWLPEVDLEAEPTPGAPLLFLASLDYSANIDSLEHFLTNIVPVLPADLPIAVAGSNPRPEALELVAAAGSRIDFLGEVDDPRVTRASALGLVVPLRHGGGTRLKIVEAWAEGIPVISTTKGAEGLGGRDGVDILLAESPAEWASAVTRLRDEPGLRRALVAEGRRTAEEKYSWQTVGKELLRSLQDVAGR